MWLRQAIVYKKAALTELIEQPLSEVAKACGARWLNPAALDVLLAEHIGRIPHCHLLYAVDTGGVLVSGNVSVEGIDTQVRGQELAERPFHSGNLPYRGLVLSPIYISRISRKRCITALHAVNFGGELLGFVAADFNLEDVPLPELQMESGAQWTQYKGDPAIRSSVFQHKRMSSRLDERIDEMVATLDVLMREHGIYHVILHFSSSRAIFWVYGDPYKYRFHGIDEVLDPEIWLAYPPQTYPVEARVAPDQIRTVLEQFRQLRLGDENIYLRSASLNVMNGIIGLTFSCDGSHYLTVDEFLNMEHPFWV